jgi:hypothetical protein
MCVARKSGPGRECSIAVDWCDCAWSPPIVVQFPHAGARLDFVAQTSKSAVSRVSKPANRVISNALPTWKSAIRQVWKPAPRAGAAGRLMAMSRCARLLDCGGKRSATPLLNAARQVPDGEDTGKAVSRPPHSKTAVAFRGFPCETALWTVFVRATPATRRTIF